MLFLGSLCIPLTPTRGLAKRLIVNLKHPEEQMLSRSPALPSEGGRANMLGAGAALGSKGFACRAGLGAGPGAPQRHTLSSSPVPERRETGWGFEGERVLMRAL